jgi:hypothetical protein
MANPITLKIEGLSALQKMIEFTDPKNFAKATRAGVTKAGSSIKTQVGKSIGERYNLKAARIKEDISKATIAPDGMSAVVRLRSRPPTLTQFAMKPGRKGTGQPGLGRGLGWGKPAKPGRPLTAMVIRADGRHSYKGAFVFIGKNGNQVVGRKDSSGKIHGVYGPSIASIFGGKARYAFELRANAERLIQDEFVKGFQKKLDDIARGYGGR